MDLLTDLSGRHSSSTITVTKERKTLIYQIRNLGSEQPPKIEGKLRLYSMLYCPYAQRVRLVLVVKGVPHDIVNINLKNKPEWLFILNSEGKVPVLDTGKRVIPESLDISEYLDEEYPQSPLYPVDKNKREADKQLITSVDPLISLYYKAAWKKEKTLQGYFEEMLPHLKKLESELEKRGTYFGGNKPGMVDYMLWPWAERVPILIHIYEENLPGGDILPRLFSWYKAMLNDDVVKQILIPTEKHYKLAKQYVTPGVVIDYDKI